VQKLCITRSGDKIVHPPDTLHAKDGPSIDERRRRAMRTWWHALSAALLVVAGSAAAQTPAQPEKASFGEAKLTNMLKGRTAGEPVDCITMRNIRSVEIADGIGILFDTIDGTRYLNRTASGTDRLDTAYTVVANTHMPDICRVDSVKLIDPGTGRMVGTANLGTFTPYRRTDR
jgi:hypothetical protein